MKGEIHLVTCGDTQSFTGGYKYNRRLIEKLNDFGFQVSVYSLDAMPETVALLDKIPRDSLIIVDSIAVEACAIECHGRGWPWKIAYLCHLPYCICPIEVDHRHADHKQFEQAFFEQASLVIVTSQYTKECLDRYVESDKLVIAPPVPDDTHAIADREGQDSHTASTGTHLVCVGNLLKGKGQRELLTTLCTLTDFHWTLTLVASRAVSDVCYENEIHGLINGASLNNRVTLRYDLEGDALYQVYRDADLFVSMTHFESYGMALADARAFNVPVIVNDVGGVRESTYMPATIYLDETPNALRLVLMRIFTKKNYLDELHNSARLWNYSAESERIKIESRYTDLCDRIVCLV